MYDKVKNWLCRHPSGSTLKELMAAVDYERNVQVFWDAMNPLCGLQMWFGERDREANVTLQNVAPPFHDDWLGFLGTFTWLRIPKLTDEQIRIALREAKEQTVTAHMEAFFKRYPEFRMMPKQKLLERVLQPAGFRPLTPIPFGD